MDNKGKANYSQVLKLEEVRKALRVGRVTALRLVQSGKVPAFRVGRDWRVLRSELNRFMRAGGKSYEEVKHGQKDL